MTPPATATDAPEDSYTPVLASRAVGDRKKVSESWAICTDIEDPRLGLMFEQLTELWSPLGLPGGWGPELATMYRQATWSFISWLVGEPANFRVSVPERLKLMREVLLETVPDEPELFADFAEGYFAREAFAGFAGFGTGGAAFSRMAARASHRHVYADPRDRTKTWALRDDSDTRALDAAWTQAKLNGKNDRRPKVLDVAALCSWAPARRLVAVTRPCGECSSCEADRPAGVEPQCVVKLRVPSAWECVATMLMLGPHDFRGRAERYVHRVCQPGYRNAKGQPYAPDAVKNMVDVINSSLIIGEKIAADLPQVACRAGADGAGRTLPVAWSNPGRVSLTADQRAALLDNMTADMAGPVVAAPRGLIRKVRAKLLRDVARARKLNRAAEWTKDDLHHALKKLLLLDLACAGFRLAEIASMEIADVKKSVDFGELGHHPAVYGRWAKGTGVRPHHVPIPQEMYELLLEWIDGWPPAASTSPVWPRSFKQRELRVRSGSLSGFFSGGGDVVPVLPNGPDGAYGAHSLKHWLEQEAGRVGWAWSEANPADAVDPQVFRDAANHHAFGEAYNYGDLEPNRQAWAARAFLGDPAGGIAGIWDLQRGPAGARRRWDTESIRSALSRRSAFEVKLGLAIGERDEADREIAATQRQQERYLAVDEDAPQDQLIREMRQMGALQIAERKQQERRYQAERRASEAERMMERAEGDLRVLRAEGKTILVDDEAPLPAELRASGAPVPEGETWDEVFARVSATVAGNDVRFDGHEDDELDLRIRRHLNGQEWAALRSISYKSVQRYWRGEREDVIPRGAMLDALVTVSRNKVFVNVDRLPTESFWELLSEGERATLELMLRTPMGKTEYGGVAHPIEDLEALDAAKHGG